MAQRYFAVTTPGLEELLVQELRTMRVKKIEVLHGGVEFDATRKGLYGVLQNTRIASRLYLRVDEFRARDRFELFRKSKRVDWARLIPPGARVDIVASSKASTMTGTGEIGDTVLEAMRESLSDMVGRQLPRPAVTGDVFVIRLVVRMHENRCLLSLDASGSPMYRRGWRQDAVRAPLRENIGAALLDALGWTPEIPLLDPMCGSGTFLIEAARKARAMPPRDWDAYMCQRWANFDEEAWASAVGTPQEVETQLFGRDQEEEAVESAQNNAARAGVDVSFEKGAVVAMAPPTETPGMIIVNPPYGDRLARAKKERAPERQLLRKFAAGFPGWTMGLLIRSDVSIGLDGLIHEPLVKFHNGTIPVTFHKIRHA